MSHVARRALSIVALTALTAAAACGRETVETNSVSSPTYVSSVVVAPSSDSLTVGQTLQLVATVSVTGGTNIARTVTWSTSNSAVATVDPSTGTLTARAAGSAAITARSTFDTTATGAASITVVGTPTTPTSPATITIASVTQGTGTSGVPIDPNNVLGQISVNLAYDPGSVTVTNVAILLTRSGATSPIICNQQSVAGTSSRIGGNAALTLVTLLCNTAAFDTTQANPSAVTTFKNGPYTLAAKLTTAGGSAQASLPVTLNNIDTIRASFANPATTPGTGQVALAFDTLGLGWRAGSVNAKVIPIIYTFGRSIASATVSLVNGGSGLAGGTNDAFKNGAAVACGASLATQSVTTLPLVTFRTDTSGGVATPTSVATVTADTVALSVTTVDSSGATGPSVNGVGMACGSASFVPAPSVVAGNFIRLDNAPPFAGAYVFTNGNVNNIVFTNPPGATATDNNSQPLTLSGSTVLLPQGYLFNAAVNNGYVPNTVANGDNNGVGRVSVAFQYTAAPFTSSSVWTTVTAASAIPATSIPTAYNLRMLETDALGNVTITNITFGGGSATTSTFGVQP